MLSAALDRLTTLASKYFVMGAFVPVLVFGFLNGVILYWEFDWFRDWAAPQISVAARAFDAAVVLVGLSVAAYVLWSLNGYLRKVLEGRYMRGDSWLGRKRRGVYDTRRRNLREDYRTALREGREIAQKKDTWTRELSNAAADGKTHHGGKNNYDASASDAARALDEVRQRRIAAEPPSKAELEEAASKLKDALSENDLSVKQAGDERSRLAEDREEFLKLVDYAKSAWVAREVNCASTLQTSYGTGEVEATAMGNVAQSMHGYAMSRYQLDLETFWSRLQPLIQKHTEFYASLQEAKTQLDFLVACVFLSGLTVAFWVVALPLFSHSFGLFVAIAGLGPLVTLALYRTAVENYLAFAEVVRTAVDLYRFELLDALHIARPGGLRDERVLWQALQRVSSFGVEWVDLSYQAETEKTT